MTSGEWSVPRVVWGEKMAWLTSLAKLFLHQALPESQLIVNGSQFYHDHPTRVNFGHEALFVYSKVFVLKEISNLCL